jgi:hypothetical protein
MPRTTANLLFSLLFFTGLFSITSATAQSKEPGLSSKFKWMAEDKQGWYNVTTFSADFFNAPVINGIKSVAGYRLNPYIALGGGIGLERYVNMPTYEELSANFSMMPVFAELRYTMLDRKFSPVVAMQVGYKYMINRSSSQVATWREEAMPPSYTEFNVYDYYHEGGTMFTVEGGVKMKTYHRLGIYLAVSYSAWSVSGEHYFWTFTHLEAPGGEVVETSTRTVTPTEAYHQVVLLHLGFTL